MIDEFLMWKQWRAKCMSYLLDERTVRILSGASLIFKAPKEQWMKVFEPLKSIDESCQNGLAETMVTVYGLSLDCKHFWYISILHCHINMHPLPL
jgi:hypothetical protein